MPAEREPLQLGRKTQNQEQTTFEPLYKTMGNKITHEKSQSDAQSAVTIIHTDQLTAGRNDERYYEGTTFWRCYARIESDPTRAVWFDNTMSPERGRRNVKNFEKWMLKENPPVGGHGVPSNAGPCKKNPPVGGRGPYTGPCKTRDALLPIDTAIRDVVNYRTGVTYPPGSSPIWIITEVIDPEGSPRYEVVSASQDVMTIDARDGFIVCGYGDPFMQ